MREGFGRSPGKVKGLKGLPPVSIAVDAEQVQEQWLEVFRDLDDPRGRQGIEHEFLSIVLIAVLATLGGATGWEDIETYGESHEDWLGSFLNFPSGIPSADTYRRLFERIEPTALERCFQSWVEQLVEATGAQVIAIDGKTLKGSYDRNRKQSSLHLVEAWASENRLLLGQVRVETKSNEITAIPQLLELLDLSGCIITLDAMGTQHKIARQIVAKKADYVLCLKANHPTLWKQVNDVMTEMSTTGFEGFEHSYDSRVEGSHGRRENRQVWAIPLSMLGPLHAIEQWAGLRTIVMVKRVRHLSNKTTKEVMFYLTSLPCDAVAIGRAIRTHWGIENSLHWVLDMTFGEDASRIRTGHAPQNMALLKRMAIGVLNQETSKKRSLRQKAKRASMNHRYMLEILAAALT